MQNFIIFCSLKFNLASKQLANDLQAALHKRNCNLLLIKKKEKEKEKSKTTYHTHPIQLNRK
jgi:hypothetical protein